MIILQINANGKSNIVDIICFSSFENSSIKTSLSSLLINKGAFLALIFTFTKTKSYHPEKECIPFPV